MILLCWLCPAVCEELFHPWFCGAVCPAPGRRGRHHSAPGRYKEGGHPGEAAATTNYIADTFDDDWMRNYRLLHNSFQILKLCGIQYMTCIENVKPHIGFIVISSFVDTIILFTWTAISCFLLTKDTHQNWSFANQCLYWVWQYGLEMYDKALLETPELLAIRNKLCITKLI